MTAVLLNSIPRSDTHKHPFFNREGTLMMKPNLRENTARAHVPGPLRAQAEWDSKDHDKNTKPR